METNFPIEEIRQQFPALHQQVYKKPLIYFDNAATTHRPQCVIDAISNYYQSINSNIHRGVHYLSQQGTDAFENTRKKVQHFINAKHHHEIIFTRGTTEAINLVAQSFSKKYLKPADEVLISAMEHHSNIVPWQMVCEERQAVLKVIPMDENGELLLDEYENLISKKTKIISLTHISNALGTINPIKKIIEIAHQKNIPVLIDGAQGIAHEAIDVQQLDVDFYCFSAHKMYGPFGIGILYGKEKWLDAMPPYQGGGEMIKNVSFEKTTYNELPFKFEAGTPNVADTIAFSSAIDFMLSYGIEHIRNHEHELLQYAEKKLSNITDIRYFGKTQAKASLLSFNTGQHHPYDVGAILDKFGIAVRTGHHCAQPVMDFFHIPGTVRASFAMYNTKQEIDLFYDALLNTLKMLG